MMSSLTEFYWQSYTEEDVATFKRFMAEKFPKEKIEEISEQGKSKEIEFQIYCYLSDATPIETALKLAIHNITMEQFQLQREINDAEIPIGYNCKATVRF